MATTESQAIAREHYTVGLICALPAEMAAMKAMLDETHQNLAGQDPSDHNNYILGQIANHNVVIASLPAGLYGTTPAATVAKDMRRTFKSIRFGLMVGIGGGAPSPIDDIRLGDIVVSQPTATSGGVIQYDRGKTGKNGEFERTRVLNTPPMVLLTALGRLQADYESGDVQISCYLSTMLAQRPKMRGKYSHQGTSNDSLYQADYDHADTSATCDRCDDSRKVQRDARADTDPVIHYGNIASGNQVIKHGATRDRLRRELKVLCFEMEAAGLMPDFPCLVIRGICDYADSHKNKIWQGYAAATAAAFAKGLLSVVSSDAVLQEKPVPQLVSDPELQMIVSGQAQEQSLRYENEKHIDCHRAFKTSNYEEFKRLNPDRVKGTCKWVLEHSKYKQWQQSLHDDLLWISADPGCGKSVLSKSLIENELRGTDDHTICYFFFKDNEDQNSITTALCALLHQLFTSQPLLLQHAMGLYQKNGEQIENEANELWSILVAAATDERAHNVTCVVDALDECRREHQQNLIRHLTDFYTQHAILPARRSQFKFLITSRPYQNIEVDFRDIPPELPSIRLAGEESNAEISEEINLVIKEKVAVAGHKLRLDQDLQSMLQAKLMEVPHRTYLWLHLVFEELYHSDKRTKKAYLKKIETLPTTVEDSYERILGRNGPIRRKETEALLHIIVGSRRPLTLSEMDVALQLATVSPNARTHEDLDRDYGHLTSRIRDLCGLFVFVSDSRIYLIHQTAKEFLVARGPIPGTNDGTWKHSLEKRISGTILTEVCVQYLSFGDIDDQRHSTNRRASKGSPIDDEAEPFLEYSAVHWAAHFRDVVDCESGSLDQIHKLYDTHNPRFRTWISILWNATGSFGVGLGKTSLHLAAFNGHTSILLRHLDTDIMNVDVLDDAGLTGLYWASWGGHEAAVRLLLEKGADVNAQSRESALQAASESGHEVIIRLLLENGADINARDDLYGTALQAASADGHEAIVRLLIENGADVNAQDDLHESALQAASANSYEAIVRLLIENGADINARDDLYGTALQAASADGHEAMVRLLIENGADVNAQDDLHESALQAASESGHEAMVRLLIENGADINAQDDLHESALQAASESGHEAIVGLLLDNGAIVPSPSAI